MHPWIFSVAEKIKTFLREFYVDGEDGGKDFVYGQQLVLVNLIQNIKFSYEYCTIER